MFHRSFYQHTLFNSFRCTFSFLTTEKNFFTFLYENTVSQTVSTWRTGGKPFLINFSNFLCFRRSLAFVHKGRLESFPTTIFYVWSCGLLYFVYMEGFLYPMVETFEFAAV